MGRAFCVVVLVGVMACGGSGPSSPVQPSPPSPPPPPAPLPAARFEPVGDRLEFPRFDPVQGWTFAARARNAGTGCAVEVRGVMRFRDPFGQELQRIAWALEPGRVVRPDEVIEYGGCCLSVENGTANDGRAYAAPLFEWRDVTCG